MNTRVRPPPGPPSAGSRYGQGEHALLKVTNNGEQDTFRVKVSELTGTGQREMEYYPAWRLDPQKAGVVLDNGESGLPNIVSPAPSGGPLPVHASRTVEFHTQLFATLHCRRALDAANRSGATVRTVPSAQRCLYGSPERPLSGVRRGGTEKWE